MCVGYPEHSHVPVLPKAAPEGRHSLRVAGAVNRASSVEGCGKPRIDPAEAGPQGQAERERTSQTTGRQKAIGLSGGGVKSRSTPAQGPYFLLSLPSLRRMLRARNSLISVCRGIG